MKEKPKPLSLLEQQELLRDDLLRVPNSLRFWKKQPRAPFTQDLLKRIEFSRYDPRIAESCIERMLLLENNIDFNFFIPKISKLPWPRSASVLFDFAKSLTQKKSLIHIFYPLIKREAHLADKNKNFESYYFDSKNPFSKLTPYAIQNNLRIWDRHFYCSLSAPYSEDLLKYLKIDSTNRKELSNRRTLKLRLIKTLESNKSWMTLSELLETSKVSLSKRQVLRILKGIPQLKTTGTLKGTRYKI
ncbi:MAG: hypothetical protein R3A80_10715 [Bdellovibrionota bacterium]